MSGRPPPVPPPVPPPSWAELYSTVPERSRLLAPWLLAAIVLAAWWPIATYWQSDDFIAVHYAASFERALSDFAGNQYGLQGLVWFYRPLITLSFAFDVLIGGGAPFVAHLGNAVAHTVSAVLVGVLACRYVGAAGGFCAGLLWGLSPSHVGSVLWAVGRVDSYATVFVLLSCWLLQRWCDGRQRTRLPALAACVVALCCKESAVCVPGLAGLLCWAAPDGGTAGVRLRAALRAAVRGAWPFAVVVAVYLGWRAWLFGDPIGGYEAGTVRVGEGLLGLGRTIGMLFDPLLYAGSRICPLPGGIWLAGLVPVALALTIVIARRRFGLLAGLALLFIGCALPSAQFWRFDANPMSLRQFYLPSLAVAGLIAAGGWLPTVLTLAVWCLPMLEIRQDYHETFEHSRNLHARLIEAAAEIGGDPLLVSGLPRTNDSGTTVAFQFGVDRLLREPFVDRDLERRVFALRPLDQAPAVIRLPYGDERGAPFGTTLAFEGDGILSLLPNAQPPPIEVTLDGIDDLGTANLIALQQGEVHGDFVVHGVRAGHYRISVFTAGGYLSAILPDAAEPGATDGRVAVLDFLKARHAGEAAGVTAYVAFALEVPIGLDLDTSFPVLVEAGRMLDTAAAGPRFEATHANRAPVWLHFDRGYLGLMRRRAD